MAAFVESTTTQFVVILISILGFLLTVINWINIDLVRKEFNRQNKEFIKTKEQIANKLAALRSQIIQCEIQQIPVDIYIKSELREELHLALRNFKHLY